MFASQLRSKDEILAIRKAEREYAKKLVLAQETVKLVREELANCYMEHGVNHKMACKALREEYGRLVMDPTHGAGLPVRRLTAVRTCLLWRLWLTSGVVDRARTGQAGAVSAPGEGEQETAEIDMYRTASQAFRAYEEETRGAIYL